MEINKNGHIVCCSKVHAAPEARAVLPMLLYNYTIPRRPAAPAAPAAPPPARPAPAAAPAAFFRGVSYANGNSPMRSSVKPCGTSLRLVGGPHATIAHAGDFGGGAAELSSSGHALGGSNRA